MKNEKLGKIAHKINIQNKSNRKYKEFIKDFFSNPSNYFNQSCNGQPFCFGKFLTKIEQNVTFKDFYFNSPHRIHQKSFFLPLMKKKKFHKIKKTGNLSLLSEYQVKQHISNQEIEMIFDRYKKKIEKNKNIILNKKKNYFLDELNYFLTHQENILTSYLNYQKETKKLEEKLQKIIQRPKSQLLIYPSNQEKFRIKKESRNESNKYFKDETDKLNFHFDKYLRQEKTFDEYIKKIKNNNLYIRRPDIPKPISKIEKINKKKKNSIFEIPKPKKKITRNLSEILIKGENLLNWEKSLIDKMKGKKYIIKNKDSKGDLSRSSSFSYNSRVFSIISSRRSDRFLSNHNLTINENENLFN